MVCNARKIYLHPILIPSYLDTKLLPTLIPSSYLDAKLLLLSIYLQSFQSSSPIPSPNPKAPNVPKKTPTHLSLDKLTLSAGSHPGGQLKGSKLLTEY